MSKADKYQAAREYKEGICACVKGAAIDPDQTIHWCQGYEWAYENIKPLINEQVNGYIVRRGFTPFCNIEAMRNNNKEDSVMQETVDEAGMKAAASVAANGCGCGDNHGNGKGWFTPVLIGAVAAFAIMAAVGHVANKPDVKADLSINADVSELRLKVTNLTSEKDTIKRELVEFKSVLVATIQKEQQIEANYNALVKDLQTVISQNNRAVTTLDRVLRDKFGKDKWFSMVKTADTDLAQEAADAFKAQMKAKEDAEKKAQTEAQIRAKMEAEVRAKIAAEQAKVKPVVEENKLTEKNTAGK